MCFEDKGECKGTGRCSFLANHVFGGQGNKDYGERKGGNYEEEELQRCEILSFYRKGIRANIVKNVRQNMGWSASAKTVSG